MTEVYIVVWSGGYEAPSYVALATKEEAFKKADDWWDDANQDGDDSDTIDVIRLDLSTMTMERVPK